MIRYAIVACAAVALSGCVTPGVTAAVHRDPARLKRVLDRPAHGGENLENVLSNSIAFDCLECVRLLLNDGLEPGADSLSAAVLAERDQIARLLFDSGADPAAALAVVHAQTRKWVGGAGISAAEAQRAADFLKKLERERAASSDASAPAAVAASSIPVVEAKTPGTRIVPSFHEEKRVDDEALVVGIEGYDGLPSAAYARRDAEAAADFVKSLGVPAGNVALLTGSGVTLAVLAKNLEGRLAEDADADSTVYFYFAGRAASDPKSGRAYLIPSDGDPKYLEQTAYPLKRLYEKLGALKAKRVIVILEAGLPAGADAGFNSADGKVALLAASDEGRTAGVGDERGYGLFSAAFFDGLNGSAKDASARVTLRSASDFAKAKVMAEASRAGRLQVPLFESGGTATDSVVLRAKLP